MNHKLTELSEELLNYPKMIEELQLEILEKNVALTKTDEKISNIESKIKTEINAEVDANGKKVYSNAEAREAELIERTKFNSDLAELRQEHDYLQKEIQEARIKVESFGNQQRNIRSILHFFANSSELAEQI